MIELVISITILLMLLIPLSHTFINIYASNQKVNNIIKKRRIEKNIIEKIKNFSNYKISKLECKNKKFSNISDLLIYLEINEKSYFSSEFSLSISKNNMRSGILNEFVGYDIRVNEEYGIYVPKE